MSDSLFAGGVAAGLRALARAPSRATARSALAQAQSPAVAAALIALSFVALRLGWARYMGLGVDESYSLAVSRDLAASYFDHPPIHYWMAHAVEPLFGVSREARVPFVLMFGGSSWLMFRLGRRLFGEAAGLWACLGLNLSGFFTLAAGGWVLPDGPLTFFQLAAASLLAELWFGDGKASRRATLTWIGAGICIGLAALSKYQAALFCAGLGAFLFTTERGRRSLATAGPWLAAGVTVAMLSPVLWWNWSHHWASFAFQAGRGAPSRLNPLGPVIALAGQFGLLLPWVFMPLAAAGIAAVQAGPIAERRWLCLMLGLPAIVIFTLAPLTGAPTLPHWPMPGWLMLFPLLGERLALAAETRAWPRRWAVASAAFVVVVGSVGAGAETTGWLGQNLPGAFRHGDPTAESIEWGQLGPVLGQSSLLREPGAFIAALKWSEAGKIDQTAGDMAPVVLLSGDLRQFAYRHPSADFVGRDALIVGKADTIDARLSDVAPYFRSLRVLPPVHVGRGGRSEMTLEVVEARGLLRPYGAGGR
jgi:4-amino-4-deoxy-L-arabinose transferase-like glycosyltransferase